MKKLFALIITFGFVSNAFADDWRMRKFDLNADEFITKDELMAAGCNYKATTFFFESGNSNSYLFSLLSLDSSISLVWILDKSILVL